MALSSAFNTQGATSAFGTPTALNNFTSNVGATPQARALTNISVGGQQTTTPQVIMPQAPTSPVSSHSVTDAAGNTVTQKYDTTPTTSGLISPAPIAQNTVDNSGGTSNANFNYTAGTAQSANQPTNVQQLSNLGTSTASSTPSNANLTQQGLLGQQQALIAKQDEEQANLTEKEQALTNNFTNMNAGILSQPGEIGYQTGRQAELQQTENTGLAALEGQQAQLAAYEQPQLAALGTSAGLLGPQQQTITASPGSITTNALTGQTYSAPTQVPYSNQLIDPTTGQSVGGGTGTGTSTLPAAAQSAVNLQIQKVQQGLSTVADAESALSAYGQAGVNALQQGLGSSFNTNASNASAGTTATGQQIQTAAGATNQALDTLGNLFSQLPGLQTGGIPLTNSIANVIAGALGQKGLTAYQTALSDARSQLIGVLNASGGTPTGNEATALQYLPDNMTVAQFNQLVGTAQNPGTARQLVAQKVAAFTQSGLQNGTIAPTPSTTGPTSLYDF